VIRLGEGHATDMHAKCVKLKEIMAGKIPSRGRGFAKFSTLLSHLPCLCAYEVGTRQGGLKTAMEDLL